MPHTIAENLQRLTAAKTAIGNAITAKGGTVAQGDGLEEFATDISNIPYNSDTSNDTVTSATLKSGYTAHNASGQQVTGTLLSQSTTVTAETLGEGVTAYNAAGELITGTAIIPPVWGLRADFENSTFTRLGNAVGLNAGSDFDNLKPWARRKCNVADDGTINAYYGDSGYTEDGSNGQVMVKQPKFYYKMIPVKLEEQSDGFGYHIRCADYYISDTPLQGYKLHPAFINEAGNEVDYYLTAAYDACIYDNSASDYLLLDEQVMDVNADKLSSIAGAKPASGLSQDLTRAKFEQLAKNRGSGWHGSTVQIESAEQLLMIIELGGFNMQSLIASGVVDIPDQSGSNLSAITGSTASYGNGTGRASNSTVINTSGTSTTYTDDDKTSICYRGRENPFGSIWQFVQGILIWGDGHQKGGIPYICNDFNFNENPTVTTGSTYYNAVINGYTNAGFTVAKSLDYISAFGYGNDVFDWLFLPSETSGNSSVPVGDCLWNNQNLSGFRPALLGGFWLNAARAGSFDWNFNAGTSNHARSIGGRTANV